jgi:hypothetical protein
MGSFTTSREAKRQGSEAWRMSPSLPLPTPTMRRTLSFSGCRTIQGGTLPYILRLFDCRLLACSKPAGRGVRLIAIREVQIRVASFCALTNCHDAGPDLAPLKLGAGLPDDAEAARHDVRASIVADKGFLTVQVDFSNAFNFMSCMRCLLMGPTACPACSAVPPGFWCLLLLVAARRPRGCRASPLPAWHPPRRLPRSPPFCRHPARAPQTRGTAWRRRPWWHIP